MAAGMSSYAESPFPLTFYAIAEPEPGPRWQTLFSLTWPGYRSWYLRYGEAARPSYATCQRMLRTHMPELLPTWQRLVDLAGGDELAARMLTLYNPPPYLAGCSQAVLTRGSPTLVRNYDYAPLLLERVVYSSAFTGRRVIGMSDCLWGLVDGMNDAGLAVSLAFGGRRVVGDGFGIPLVLRYLLEVCETVADARRTLRRLPIHMAYNLTVVDREGEYFTALLSPDREPRFIGWPAATNHQEPLDWPEQAQATRSLERQQILHGLLNDKSVDVDRLVGAFLRPPLYSTAYSLGFGTLYTAVYRPAERTVEYRWPGSVWRHWMDTPANGEHAVTLGLPAA
jgi:predicted choloylglycine hydrolase